MWKGFLIMTLSTMGFGAWGSSSEDIVPTTNPDYDIARRRQVSFDAFYFERQQDEGKSYSMRETFEHINVTNLWGADTSVSGEGSTDQETSQLKVQIPQVLEKFRIQSMTDAPCGDFGWLSRINLPKVRYIGVDIVSGLLDSNKRRFSESEERSFVCADIVVDPLPRSDLILCRDCLVHFSFSDIFKALANFKVSGSRYLLMTNFPNTRTNFDIVTGDWRPLNFQLPPFNFPEPLHVIREGCQQNDTLYEDKSLALWEIADLILQFDNPEEKRGYSQNQAHGSEG